MNFLFFVVSVALATVVPAVLAQESKLTFNELLKDPTSTVNIVRLEGKADDGSDCALRMVVIGVQRPIDGWLASTEKHGYACKLTTIGPVFDQDKKLKDQLSIPAADEQCFEMVNRSRDPIRGPTVEGAEKFWNVTASAESLSSLTLRIDPFSRALTVNLSKIDARTFHIKDSTETETFTCGSLH